MKNIYRNLIQEYQLKPSKRLGQNFLVSRKVLKQIIEAADISKKDIVLEIGPGLGILTQGLARRAKKVIAVEKDRRLAEILKELFKEQLNAQIIQGDILKWASSQLTKNSGLCDAKLKSGAVKSGTVPVGQGQSLEPLILWSPYKIVANIPYYLTSPLIRLFLEAKNPPKEMTLLVQKEVAQRICSQPPKMSLLAAAVQFYSQPKIIDYVSKRAFWPQPKVDSAILKISQIRKPKDIDPKKFFRIVKAGFSQPRKFLVSNLAKGLNIATEKTKTALVQCHLDIKTRAENLSVEEWRLLTSRLANEANKAGCSSQ